MGRINPFAPLYEGFNSGDPARKWAQMPDFPRMIDLEPAGICNLRCLMCPTGIHALGRPQDFMAWSTYERIVSECAKHGTALRFIGWGEPMLNPRLIDMIKLATEEGLLTHINTNGTQISPSKAYDLIAAGLASIKFSFQGVDAKTYAEMRRADFFEGVIEAIETFRNARGARFLPFIAASTSITTESKAAIESFHALLEPLVDYASSGNTIFGYLNLKAAHLLPGQKEMIEKFLDIEQRSAMRHPDPCPEVFDKLSIHWDGSVMVCCNAYGDEGKIGNVNETPIAELWHHPEMEAYRARLSRKEYEGPLCSTCYDYADLTKGAA